MIPVERVRALELEREAGATDTRRVEAASGLAVVEDTLYVVTDDELYVAIFRDMGAERGTVARMLPGELPRDYDDRKDEKPDLESLTPLPPFGRFAHGGLVAFGSGSSEDRCRGAFASFDPKGAIEEVVELQLGPLVEELQNRIEGLNLEGTAITGDVFRVLQRGNEEGSVNAHIDLDLAGLCRSIEEGAALSGDLVRDVREHDLVRIRGVDLCFSDADTLDDGRIVFSASAEPPEDGADGPSIGSAIGLMSSAGDIEQLEPIDIEIKVEGVAVRPEDGANAVYMVTDEDSPEVPSDLCRVELPWR